MKIGKINIGLAFQPFIIAEMSGNHNQSLDRALEIVQAAANSGAQALKLQTYTADTITLDIEDREFLIDDKHSLWYGKTLYQLYQEAHTPWEWHKPIMDLANELGMVCFSTPFDDTAVDFLEELDVPAYKIASFENSHIPLLKKVAETGKPMIISTGMATISQLDETVRTITKSGCDQFMLLKCTSNYPSTPENSNVLTIPHMRDLFNCEIGLSDHTMGIGSAVAAVAHGATAIEKHFTLSRADKGVDSAFSLEPEEMKKLVVESERAWQSLGKITYGATSSEKKSIIFRRSIYASQDIKKNESLNQTNIKVIRPGLGLAPKHFNNIIGSKARKDIKKGTPLSWDLLLKQP